MWTFQGKAKSDKNRQRVEEEFLKSTHAARAEAAAQRREDKRKQEKGIERKILKKIYIIAFQRNTSVSFMDYIVLL